MKKLTFLALAALLWTACKQSTGSEKTALNDATAVAAVDSLNNAMDEAWNKKDSAAVVAMFSDDVIMISGRRVMKGKEEVAKKFIGANMPVTSNLKSKVERVDASGDVGYEAGTWSLTVTVPNQAPFESTGNYNFASKKGEDGKWKFTVLSMEDHDPVKTTK